MKGARPQWAFIHAVQAQGDSDWSGQHLALMIGSEEDDKPPPTLQGLINRYNRWVSTKRLHTRTLGSFSAQEATPITEPKPKLNSHRLCVCGLSHELWKCFILNLGARGCPEGYTVGSETGQTSREKKVVVLRELHRAIIYTTEMSKQVTKSHVRDAVHMYPVN